MAACVRVKTPRQIERVGPSTATTHLQLLVLASKLIETRSRGGQRELERLVACNDLLHCLNLTVLSVHQVIQLLCFTL